MRPGTIQPAGVAETAPVDGHLADSAAPPPPRSTYRQGRARSAVSVPTARIAHSASSLRSGRARNMPSAHGVEAYNIETIRIVSINWARKGRCHPAMSCHETIKEHGVGHREVVKRQYAAAVHGRFGLTLILVAAFMVVLDFSIVNVALPSIQRELGISAASVQWVITAYAIAFGGLLILGGRASDLYGRRRMFLAGIGVFTAASLAGGLARDPVLLIAARVVQGGAAGMAAPAAVSLTPPGFPEAPGRTGALGLYGATASVGFVAGQVLGGVLVEF